MSDWWTTFRDTQLTESALRAVESREQAESALQALHRLQAALMESPGGKHLLAQRMSDLSVEELRALAAGGDSD